jgi:hypothetical protein
MTLRRANRIDANQTAVINALESAGFLVANLSPMGCGVPDLLVGDNSGLIAMVEVKTIAGALTASEKRFAYRYPGWVLVAHTPEMAVEKCQEIRRLR